MTLLDFDIPLFNGKFDTLFLSIIIFYQPLNFFLIRHRTEGKIFRQELNLTYDHNLKILSNQI